jgi:glycerophosphoryl diester phosphodiesterase
MMSGQLDGIDAGEPARFGRLHAGTALPRLSGVVELMTDLGDAHAFVEVKRASLVHHGRANCIGKVLAALAPVRDRCVLISFDADACRLARAAGKLPIGWVLDGDPVQLRPVIELMRPEYLFCDHRRLPAARALPSGPWTWVAYEVTGAEQALELAARGVGMVESMAPLRLAGELAARETLRA